MIVSHEPSHIRSRIGRIVAVLILGAGALWWIESTRPEPPSAMERAGGPVRPAPIPTEAGSGHGASPLSPDPARHRVFRSPLEQSPGYVPPSDPESMSVITGRREAPLVTGAFTGGAPSLQSLVASALDAVRRGDETALHGLRATRGEFERFLWREFPQSRPVTRITASDAWEMMSFNSLAGATSAAGSWSGKALEIVRIESSGRREYRNFTMWRDVVIHVRDAATGEEHRLTFLPAVVERHGRHKVFNYKD